MASSEVVQLILGLIGVAAGAVMFWSLPVPGRLAHRGEELPLLSIIIPARNEEGRIKPLLESLRLQARHVHGFEVIVVDDHSTDRTADIARAYGAEVLSPAPVHDGAGGKSAACWQGARHAKGAWLLFLDADTYFVAPDSLLRLLAAYRKEGARGILSLQPFHTVRQAYEQLSAIFNIIVIAGMNVFTPAGRRLQPAGSFGPCLLCNRDDYMLAGGHGRIQEAIMDDLALGQAFLAQGLPVRCLGGKSIICFRMYPEGLGSLVQGWCKSFALGSKATHPLVMLLSILWISGSFVSASALVAAIPGGALLPILASAALYGLYAVQTLLFASRCGNFKRAIFVVHPLLFLFFSGLFAYSLFRVHIMRSVYWRGRKIKSGA